MKEQLQKTIAELIITRELLKLEIDKQIEKVNTAPKDNLLKAARELTDLNNEIQMIMDLIRVLSKKEQAL